MADEGVFLLGTQVFKGDAASWVSFEAHGGVADNTDVGVGLSGGALESG